MTFTPEQIQAVEDAAKQELWRRGDISWKLDSNQYEIYRLIEANSSAQWVLELARRVGKSFLLGVLAVETCLKHPGERVNLCFPTTKNASEVAIPIINEICQDAPAQCRPIITVNGHVTFPNKAYTVLFGSETTQDADRGRGPRAKRNLLDEAGFNPTLRYTLGSVLNPQLLGTGGGTILASSPPLSPGHDFCSIADAAAMQGTYVNRNVYSNDHLTREQIDKFLQQEAGNRGLTIEEYQLTSDYLREFMAQRVIDSSYAIIPEFQKNKSIIVQPHPRPTHYQLYEAIDPGMVDRTGVVQGYYDYRNALLVIESELLLNGANTATIAKELRQSRDLNFPQHPVHMTVVDDPGKRVCADLYNDHQITAQPALKDDKAAAINNLRLLVASKRLRINPQCKALIRQLETGVYAKNKRDFSRTTIDGHMDLLAAAVYFARSVDQHYNPYPSDADLYSDPTKYAVRWKEPTADPLVTAMGLNTNFSRRLLRGIK
jgi:hypothetical protein